jgi:DNA-nicking Smr family endonuclease
MGRRRPSRPEPPRLRASLHAAVVEDERDLHALTAAEASLRLESFLTGWSRRRPGAVVRVITGKGTRSASGPVLKPLVGDLLRGRLAALVDDYVAEASGGSYLIRVRRETRG